MRPLGRQLNLAVAEYTEVMKLLRPGVSLREAATNFAFRHDTVRDSRNAPELVVEDIAAREKARGQETGQVPAHFFALTRRLLSPLA